MLSGIKYANREPPMPKHLRREEIVTIQVLIERRDNWGGGSTGGGEGTVRYRRSGGVRIDWAANKPFKAEP
jgi:hypothetical protein